MLTSKMAKLVFLYKLSDCIRDSPILRISYNDSTSRPTVKSGLLSNPLGREDGSFARLLVSSA